jgi:hypothetical protein
MGFKKLALASAILAVPVAGFSMEAIDDQMMSEVSGQDGIEAILTLGASGIQTDIYLHDKTGLDNSLGVTSFTSYSFDGAIVIDNMQVAVGGGTIEINIDAGDSASVAAAPILNVNVRLPNALTIATGSIHVANSGRDAAVADFGITGTSATILNTMTIVLGGTALNIQLGGEVQTGAMAGTDMIAVSAVVTGGISITGFRLSDSTGGGDGGIGANGAMTIEDNGVGTNLTLGIDINATDAGLVIGLGQVGAAATGVDINIINQYLGTSTNSAIGDVSIIGLNVNGATLTINGK